jgi:hypothetical protein
MSNRPNFSQFASRAAGTSSVDILAVSHPQKPWRRLLRPGILEVGVVLVDIF